MPPTSPHASSWHKTRLAAVAVICLAASVILAGRAWRSRPNIQVDQARTITVRCAACKHDFTMPYAEYKNAVEARTNLDKGIRCALCGVQNSAWRSLDDPANTGGKLVLPPVATPGQTPDSPDETEQADHADPETERRAQPVG